MNFMRGIKAALFSCAALGALTAVASAEDAANWGSFPGYTLKVKLVGGTQYEKLYTRIPEWEKATGAKVEIVSSKNHFELDREIKQDIASGTITWCVGSNHTSFAPQYGDLYVDLKTLIPQATLDEYVPGTLAASMVDGRLVQLPRVTDVSNLYGTAFAGKDEGMTGRFMEIVRANGGDMFDENWKPIFNSQAGVDALQWFIDIYNAKAVPAGTVNYTWDDIGQAFAAGTLAVDLDWPGFAAFYNDPAKSKVAGKVGFALSPVGTAGKRGGWSGSHSFSITQACDNKEAAASLITFLTDYDSEMLEARAGNLPTRTKAFTDVVEEFKKGDTPYMAEMFAVWEKSLAEARTPPLIPQWIEVSNVIWPELQAAIVGQKTAQEALDTAAKKATQIMEDAGVLQ